MSPGRPDRVDQGLCTMRGENRVQVDEEFYANEQIHSAIDIRLSSTHHT